MMLPLDHYTLLGNPVEHSLSPTIHARFAQLTGQSLRYDKQLVPLGQFAEHLAQLRSCGARGCNVTVPFKLEAFSAAHSHSERAALAMAANTLRFDGEHIAADNTDGIGLVTDIERNAGVPLAGLDVLLIGAGGASAGVLGPLLQTGPRRLVVVNRTESKAVELVQRHQAAATLQETLQKTELSAHCLQGLEGVFDVIINATTSSLSGASVPVSTAVLKPGALAYDMMYGAAATSFAVWATAAGARARDGLGMLVEQAAEAFYFWRGVRPPTAQVLDELRARLGKHA